MKERSELLDLILGVASLYLIVDGVTGGKLTRWVESKFTPKQEVGVSAREAEFPVYGVAREAEEVLKRQTRDELALEYRRLAAERGK